jgi:hypothetical protein
MIYQYPLAWPVGWPRTKYQDFGQFKVHYDQAVRDLGYELERLDATSAYLSTDQPLRVNGTPRRDTNPDLTGVALYFSRHGKDICIPCDKFASVRDNIRAIGLTLQNLRQMERYGTSQMVDAAFQGLTAIPASASAGIPVRPKRPWYEVLGVSPDAPREVIEAAGKAMQRKTHPDAGGSTVDFQEVQEAIRKATQGV